MKSPMSVLPRCIALSGILPSSCPNCRICLKVSRKGFAGQGTAAERSAAVNGFDEKMMQRALQLARKGVGKTAPNPAVGCVIVKDGVIVGKGGTEKQEPPMPKSMP